MNELIKLRERLGTIRDLQRAAAVLDWDQQTYMPSPGAPARARQISTLQTLAHEWFTAKETGKLLETLQKYQCDLNEEDRILVEVTSREFEKQIRIPSSLVEELSRITSETFHVWQKAKSDNVFSPIVPYWKEIFRLTREVADHLGYNDHPYDALIDQYEPGTSTKELTGILSPLVEKLRLFRERYTSLSEFSDRFSGVNYPAEAQLQLATRIIQALGFRMESGRIDLSAHPFTTSFDPADVRLTTRIHPEDFRPAFFGAIHEAGHGIYEQHLPAEHARDLLGDAASLGFHESQSRFFENMIGRNDSFWTLIYPLWKETFPEASVRGNLHDLIRYVNAVKPTLIRVEADEVTYNLHIIIRFLLEKDLVAGELQVEDLPEKWDELTEHLLGIRPSGVADGVLQDIHWSIGLIGYFPTYTLGNLISAQLKESLESDLGPLDRLIGSEKYQEIVRWMNEKVYRHGKKYLPADLIQRATGRPLSPEPFLRYIQNKYDRLSQLY